METKEELRKKIVELQAQLKKVEDEDFSLTKLKFKSKCLFKWIVLNDSDDDKDYLLIKKICDNTDGSITIYGNELDISYNDITIEENVRRTYYNTASIDMLKFIDHNEVKNLIKKAQSKQLEIISV